jgi:hypothetical protein
VRARAESPPPRPIDRLAGRALAVSGVALILVALLHLAMTDEIGQIVRRNTTGRAFGFLWPPYQLDHVAVGVLMMALGAVGILMADGVRSGDPRAWRVGLVVSASVVGLAVSIMFTVGLRYFGEAPAFALAAAVIGVVGIGLSLPLLLGLRR